MPQSPPAVFVDGVHKTFERPSHQVHTLKERALHPLRRSGTVRHEALQDVSFAVERGEFFGIVGRNGSGKSTLLKCLAGIYATDAGAIHVDGRLSTFIELGVGFNPDLPARDNVMINGTLLGLSPREARRRFDRVIDFAELHDFVDLKLKNYSSGMLVRLAFAVMIQVDAEVLLIDEVLAVGDAAFQQKCFDEFAAIRESGRTVLLVTHDMGAVQRFCDRAMLLEQGRVVELGDPERVGQRYLEVNFSTEAREDAAKPDAAEQPAPAPDDADGVEDEAGPEPAPAGPARYGDGRARICEAWFEDGEGRRAEVLPTGGDCAFAARVRFLEEVEDPLFGVVLQNSRRDTVVEASTLWDDPHPGTFRAGEEVTFRFSFANVLAPDRYHATPAVARGGSGIAWIDRVERMASIVVTGVRPTDAIVDLPFRIELHRRAPDGELRGAGGVAG